MENINKVNNRNEHSLTLLGRKSLSLTGIEDVISFDENGILLLTSEGTLTVDGSDIRIVTLCVESGDLTVEGRICGLYYVDKTAKKSGFFARKNEK
jgi:sporulation protein YabP